MVSCPCAISASHMISCYRTIVLRRWKVFKCALDVRARYLSSSFRVVFYQQHVDIVSSLVSLNCDALAQLGYTMFVSVSCNNDTVTCLCNTAGILDLCVCAPNQSITLLISA